MPAKVLVAMSGGVDSSMTAWLLKSQGFDVQGASFVMHEHFEESLQYACNNAEFIGIKHHIIDIKEVFKKNVIEFFISQYKIGNTPNPCVHCNKTMKFPSLLKTADSLRFDMIATGHYANVDSLNNRYFLKKAVDTRKDQSYALYGLSQDILSRLILPLGQFKKSELKQIANQIGLPSANRLESQDICFLAGGSYSKYLTKKEGAIIDDDTGQILGRHNGFYNFTIGQRRRLGISTKHPLYVVKIDSSENIVYVGERQKVLKKELLVSHLNWQLFEPTTELKVTAKIRSTMIDEPALLLPIDSNTVRLVFDDFQWTPAKGQSAVFYQQDRLLGGGIITEIC